MVAEGRPPSGTSVVVEEPAGRAPVRTAEKLCGALAVTAAAAGAVTVFVPGLLRGTAVMNGSARGTAWVLLFLGVPALMWSTVAASRGSVRASVVRLGVLAYVAYNAVLFLFATPFNRAFPLYVLMAALTFWSVVALLRGYDLAALRNRFSTRLPARTIAGYLLVVTGLNTLAWLARIVPALVGSPTFLDGTGLPTNPVYVQDLAFWLPLYAVAAVLLWRGQDWGYLFVGAFLVMWVIEGVGVAVDQWWGHAADPTSPVASLAAVPMFLGLAVIGLVPLFAYLRSLEARPAANGHASGR